MSTSPVNRTIITLTIVFAAAIAFTPRASAAGGDAKATHLLNSVLAAHRHISAMTCTVKLRQQEGSKPVDTVTVNFAYRKPDCVKMTMTGPTGTLLRCSSNGKHMLLYSPPDHQYLSQPIDAGHSGATAIVSASQSKILKAYVRPQALIESLSSNGTEAHYAGTSTVEGVPVDLLSASMPGGQGRTLTVACGFGRKDHLLRSISVTTMGADGPVSRVDEIVSQLSLSPRLTNADFTLSIPKGASQVTPDADDAMYDPRLKPGTKPFPIDATDIDGRKVSLSQYRGKVLLIDFWATWCGPCMMEMPNVQAVYKKYHSRGLEVVGFSQDQDESRLKSVLAERGIPWRQVFCGASEAGEKVPMAYGIQAIPFMVVVGRDGKIVAVDVRGPEIEDAVASAIAK